MIKGRYFYSKSQSIGSNNFLANLTFPLITLNEQGEHLLTFYALVYCNQPGCDTTGDKIIVDISDRKQLISSDNFDAISFEKQRIWLKKEIKFDISETNLNVINK